MKLLLEKIDQERDLMINFILLVFTVLGGVVVAASFARISFLGWHPIICVHASLFLLSSSMMLFRHSFSYRYKAILIIVITYIAAVAGLLSFGLLGGNIILWVVAPIFAVVFFNVYTGIAMTIINTITLFSFGVIVNQGLWVFTIDMNHALYDFSSWLLVAVSCLCFATIAVLAIGKVRKLLLDNLIQIEEQAEALKLANASKDRLFSVVAHDLRNPFQGLIMSLEMMDRCQDDMNDKGRERVEKLLFSTKKTILLLENLLTWARFQKGDMKISKRNVSLKDLVSDCVEAYLPYALHKDIVIDNIVGNVEIFSDETCMRIVVTNLLNNAIKFTEERGRITIGEKTIGKDKVLYVQDTGIGIPEGVFKKLFDDNDHMTTFGTCNEKGTGIGLGLCYDLVNMNGGEIWVESVEKFGSTFYVRF